MAAIFPRLLTSEMRRGCSVGDDTLFRSFVSPVADRRAAVDHYVCQRRATARLAGIPGLLLACDYEMRGVCD